MENKEEIAKMSRIERIKLVDSILVTYPLFGEIFEIIKEHHLENKPVEPDCLFIGGETGVGKSTLKDEYIKKYPQRIITGKGSIVPILSSLIPAKASIKGTASRLLQNLGDPACHRGSVDTMTGRLLNYLQDCQVSLIILDELNHLIDRDSESLLKLVSDWIKEIIVESNVPVIAFGLPTAQDVLDPAINAQLSRRFVRRLSLKPLSWSEDDNNQIRNFLYLVDEKIPLMSKSNLAEEETALRIFYATDGNISYIMNLARYGTRLALKQKKERLDLEILSTVFDEYVKNERPWKSINPFSMSATQVQKEIAKEKIVKSDNVPHSGKATNNRVKTKKDSSRVSDVLR